MVKLSAILYITIGVGLLFFLSRSPKLDHDPRHHDDDPHNHHLRGVRRHGRGHRRLKLRSNFTFTSQDHLEHYDPHHDFRHHHHEPVAFDPVVAEFERRREDKEWERMYFEEHHREFAEIARHAEEAAEHHQRHHIDHRHQQEVHHGGHHYEGHPGGHHYEGHPGGHHYEGHPGGHQFEDHHGGNQQWYDPGHAPGHEHQPEWEDFMDNAEDYLNDEERFNVTNRLVVLFPKIDLDLTDGFVSEKELTQWHVDQAAKEVLHRTQREMELHDKNRDGFISFAEYEPPSWVKSSDNNSFGYDMGWWKEEHFNASDMNGDGLLNITEFNDFLHPADTKNPKLLQWLCKEEIRERDTDKDGKVNFNEFFHGLFDLVRNYEEEGHNSTNHLDDSTESPAARKLFDQLDKDGDGFLTDTELLPIIGKLHPSERYYAKQQADYIISQADTDKDGRLSLAEMIENPFVFYSTIFSDEDEYYYHDELR